MAIYEPTYSGTGIYSGVSLGKDVPAMGPFRSYNPKYLGFGGGKVKAVISGLYYASRYFRKNPRFGARIGAVAAGAGIRYASDYKKHQALRPFTSRSYRKRSYNRATSRDNHCRRCCSCTSQRCWRRMFHKSSLLWILDIRSNNRQDGYMGNCQKTLRGS